MRQNDRAKSDGAWRFGRLADGKVSPHMMGFAAGLLSQKGGIMTKFFMAANVWLMLAILAFIGRTYERSAPVRYSFFHNVRWLSAESYTLVVATLAAISAVFF